MVADTLHAQGADSPFLRKDSLIIKRVINITLGAALTLLEEWIKEIKAGWSVNWHLKEEPQEYFLGHGGRALGALKSPLAHQVRC